MAFFYNGFITFQAYATDGSSDAAANISVTVNNPDPLGPYLVWQVRNVSGNDSTVIDAFKVDLHPAYNTTQALIPTTTWGSKSLISKVKMSSSDQHAANDASIVYRLPSTNNGHKQSQVGIASWADEESQEADQKSDAKN